MTLLCRTVAACCRRIGRARARGSGLSPRPRANGAIVLPRLCSCPTNTDPCAGPAHRRSFPDTPHRDCTEQFLHNRRATMPFTICAFNQAEWDHFGLADFSDFAEMISECNVGEDSFSGFGEWFFAPDEPLPSGHRVIYFGSWDNDNSPGASTYTHAELFDMADVDDAEAFERRAENWENEPEHVETIGEFEDEANEPWDETLAQQELEDFEQADEYFGQCGEGDF